MQLAYPTIILSEAYTNWYRYISLGLVILAIPTNLILLYILVRVRLFNVSHQLIGLLAVSDLLHGVVIISARAGELIYEVNPGDKLALMNDLFCQTLGVVSHGLICTSAYLLGLLAYERYRLVCHERMVNPSRLWVIFAFTEIILVIPLVMISLNKNLGVDPLRGYCLPKGSIWAAATSLILVGSFILPLAVLIFCYLSITFTIFQVVPDLSVRRSVTFKSITFITLYSLCYLPQFVVSIWLRINPKSCPHILHMIGPLGVIFPHLLNPLLVMLIHSQFKREAKRLFRRDRRSSLKSFA